MIRAEHLHKYFQKGKQNEIHVINDVDLTLPDRGIVAIFGKSGCGKTTLLNVIGGLDGFDSGTLTIDGQSINGDTDTLRNRYIGYIFQNYNLLHSESCFENVANALRLCGMTDEQEIKRRTEAALASVGMAHYGKRPPNTLSGGQQQRIAIARAIVKNPRIILADEPTGNLDEANTVMIMDLLRAIADQHLVLLVTHEENLVDAYADTVIELSDGKIVGIRQNKDTGGYVAKSKNDIYLGELEHTALSDDRVSLSYYGKAPEEPVKLRVVNHDGKLYLKIDSPDVRVLDETAETTLREGVFEVKKAKKAATTHIDMSALPPMEGGVFGRLFTFASSLKSGYRANLGSQKRGKRLLRACMCLFAAAMVLMSAVFGTSFADILTARDAYNHHVFYLYTPDGTVSDTLTAALGSEESAIDYLTLHRGAPTGDRSISFRYNYFETFTKGTSSRTNAVYLSHGLAASLPLKAGKKEGLADEEILLTTAVADKLLETASAHFISDYRDLLGLVMPTFSVDGKSLRVAGVVKSNESAVYVSDYAQACFVRSGLDLRIRLVESFGMGTEAGEVIYVLRGDSSEGEHPSEGDRILIHGVEMTVSEILRYYASYDAWLAANGRQKNGIDDYFSALAKQEDPTLTGTALTSRADALKSARYFEYFDYYYADFDAFLGNAYFFASDYQSVLAVSRMCLWLATQKDIEEARLMAMADGKEYYQALRYKALYGSYPTIAQYNAIKDSLPTLSTALSPYYELYEAEYEMTDINYFHDDFGYLLSREDYIAVTKRYGDTVKSATYEGYGYVKEIAADRDPFGEVYYIDEDIAGLCYTLIHSKDPARTAKWLEESFGSLTAPKGIPVLYTPDDIFDILIAENALELTANLITILLSLVVMSVCMYLIMRSSLMNRIKEIGIYRAIGVSKKNMLFKFLAESTVLTLLTILPGYLLASAFLFAVHGISPLVENIFYYPLWLALADLLLLFLLGTVCGILPILSLLRKTPSEILAKYDI